VRSLWRSIPQWEACLLYDQRTRLPACTVPMHVLAFDEDVQAPPQDAEELVELTPTAELHRFEGMGQCSIYGHTHDVLNPFIRGLVRSYLPHPTQPEEAGRPVN
jgi:pimeloyl-ACP methyl ester carboxylesterase